VTSNVKTPLLPTVSRFHADYVVTEFGVASLREKTTKARAAALMEISHPDFKDRLLEEGRKAKLFS